MQCGGDRFEPGRVHQSYRDNEEVAGLNPVRSTLRLAINYRDNEEVTGSSPLGSTKLNTNGSFFEPFVFWVKNANVEVVLLQGG